MCFRGTVGEGSTQPTTTGDVDVGGDCFAKHARNDVTRVLGLLRSTQPTTTGDVDVGVDCFAKHARNDVTRVLGLAALNPTYMTYESMKAGTQNLPMPNMEMARETIKMMMPRAIRMRSRLR